MSGTPRTDGAIAGKIVLFCGAPESEVVGADFVRRLERELNACQKERERLAEKLAELHDYLAQLN